MDYLWIVVLFFISIMMMAKPNLLWEIEHMFSVKGGEPTELYLALMRVGGIFLFIIAIIFTLLSFT